MKTYEIKTTAFSLKGSHRASFVELTDEQPVSKVLPGYMHEVTVTNQKTGKSITYRDYETQINFRGNNKKSIVRWKLVPFHVYKPIKQRLKDEQAASKVVAPF